MKDFIQLKKDNILRIGIKDSDGNDTGNHLEFDLEDIELPLTYQKLLEEDKKNKNNLKNQMYLIDQKQDHKGKKLLSSNQEAKTRLLIEFFKREAEIYNMFLGENGVEKLLHGRKLGWRTLEEIDEIMDKYVIPKLDIKMDNITKKIKEKYPDTKEDNTLE